MIPADQDPGILPDGAWCVPCTATTLLDCLDRGCVQACTDVPAPRSSLAALCSVSLPPLSSHLSHISSLTSPPVCIAGQRGRRAQLHARPHADGWTDRRTCQASRFLVPVPAAVPDARAGARWLARRLRNEADLSSGSLVYDATKISLSQSQEPNLNVSRLQWYL